jgi:caffeoyl-CoA O-methyltransferase
MIPREIEQYCIEHSTPPSEIVREIGDYTKREVHGSHMLIGEMEAAVITFLIKLGRVKTILELGTFTGYSALAMAEQLPSDGKVITIDINPHTSKIAKSYWDKSPHGEKITQILAPGMEAIKTISEKFDLIFIDADKNNYPHYLDWALDHTTEKGLIITDNTLWHGKVLQTGTDKQTDSIILHNINVRKLSGYTKVLLPIRDGMYLIQKD